MKKKNKPLKIGIIAPPWLSVPPGGYGGTELVVHGLTEGLVELGHAVTLFASGDSKTKARLISPYSRALRRMNVPWTNCLLPLGHLYEALEHQHEFDIIHSHIDTIDTFFAQYVTVPFISTVHRLLHPRYSSDLRLEAYTHYPKHKIITISEDQRKKATVDLDYIATVRNGIPLSQYVYNKVPDTHFAWLGRVIEYKGVLDALEAAKKAKVSLKMAGVVEGPEEGLFEKSVKPALSKRVVFVGEVTGKKKNTFLGSAKALLCPVKWEEPFGLVLIEAMACGTPVIAFNRGAIPEIVVDGKTGFIVENVDEMVEAMQKIDMIDRKECRKHVEKNFTAQKMAKEYEKVYYAIIQKEKKEQQSHSCNT